MKPLRLLVIALLCVGAALAQETVVPHMIRFAGEVKDANGTVGITFTLHKSESDGEALWTETQNVKLDPQGRYTVLLGITKPDGLPTELFTSGDAQWLGIRVDGHEQRRVLLVSVPYAMKAAEAETLSGKPLSAFVLASPDAKKSADGLTYSNAATASVTPYATAGTTNYISMFVNATDLGNSAMYQSGTKLGINTTSPLATLHVVSPAGSASGGYFDVYSGAPTTAPFVPMFQRSARGTSAAPSATQLNDYLGGFGGAGYTGTAFTNNRAGMFARAAENWTTTSNGSYMQFITTATGTATTKEAMRIMPDGKIGIGTTAPAATLDVNGTAQFRGLVTFNAAQTFPGGGSVSSVGLTAPASDFTVTGSPVTNSGTLGLNWAVAPTSANTANAIVKRDATGSFSVNNITESGQLTIVNGSSLNPISVTATAPGATAISAYSQGTGLTDGIISATVSSTRASSGIIGIDQNSNGAAPNYTAGVTGVTTNPVGVGVFGYGTLSSVATNDIGYSRVGMWGDDTSGAGIVATSDTGNALIAVNTSSVSTTTNMVNNGAGSAIVAANTSSTGNPTLLAQNNTSFAGGVILKASAPNVTSNGSPAFCQVTTHGDMGCTGDVYQNAGANGLVKALVYADPTQPAGSQIVHCFNSALAEPAASTPPCGFTFDYALLGNYGIDLKFSVTNRFFQATAVYSGGQSVGIELAGTSNTIVYVTTLYTASGTPTDTPFYLTVF